MSDILKFFSDIEVKLTEEELIEYFKQDVSEEEAKKAREYITSLGFDLKSFCTEGNRFLTKVFSCNGSEFSEKVREAVTKIQATFRSQGPLHSLIKLLYALGFSLRDITFTLYRLGIRGIGQRTIRTHINNNQFEFEHERGKLMDLVDCAKATVFQEMQVEIKSAEKRSAEIYLKIIDKVQTALEEIDPIIETVKFTRYTKQIEALQAKLNSMHGVDELRIITIQTASKISILKAAKEIEFGPQTPDALPNAKTIDADGDVVSPFTEKADKIITVPSQQLVS